MSYQLGVLVTCVLPCFKHAYLDCLQSMLCFAPLNLNIVAPMSEIVGDGGKPKNEDYVDADEASSVVCMHSTLDMLHELRCIFLSVFVIEMCDALTYREHM